MANHNDAELQIKEPPVGHHSQQQQLPGAVLAPAVATNPHTQPAAAPSPAYQYPPHPVIYPQPVFDITSVIPRNLVVGDDQDTCSTPYDNGLMIVGGACYLLSILSVVFLGLGLMQPTILQVIFPVFQLGVGTLFLIFCRKTNVVFDKRQRAVTVTSKSLLFFCFEETRRFEFEDLVLEAFVEPLTSFVRIRGSTACNVVVGTRSGRDEGIVLDCSNRHIVYHYRFLEVWDNYLTSLMSPSAVAVVDNSSDNDPLIATADHEVAPTTN